MHMWTIWYDRNITISLDIDRKRNLYKYFLLEVNILHQNQIFTISWANILQKVVSHNTHITGYQYLHVIRLFGYFMFTAISMPYLLPMKSVCLKLEAWCFLNVIEIQTLQGIFSKLMHDKSTTF